MEPVDRTQTIASRERERVEKLSTSAKRSVLTAISRKRKLIANLRGDLERHGDPDRWRKFGDLLLANIGTAERRDEEILVTDHFDALAPTVIIKGDPNLPLTEIANDYFRKYAKARNARRIIEERMAAAETAVEASTLLLSKIDQATEAGDVEFLASVLEPRRQATEVRRKKKKDVTFNGARRFVSTDGFEILVGKRAQDNDTLTFRVARSLDTWMHASDYPGSHVVIRNPNRKDIPQRTLNEAAQLAAFYSGARELGKAAVNYTLKKFVNKPKRAAAGLVSLASFKTLYVSTSFPTDLNEN